MVFIKEIDKIGISVLSKDVPNIVKGYASSNDKFIT